MSLKLNVREVGDVSIVDAVGRITLGEGAYSLRTTVQELCSSGRKKIIINLADTTHVDSSGIGALISGFSRLHSFGGTLKLLAISERVKDLLQVTKLYTVFETFDDEETAVASFR